MEPNIKHWNFRFTRTIKALKDNLQCFIPWMKSMQCVCCRGPTRTQIIWKSKVVGEDILMSLSAAVLVALNGRMPCILAEMNVNVIGWAEECCNQAGSSCQDVSGGACVTK